MSALDLGIPATSFVDRYDRELTAALSIGLALVAAGLVDRAFTRRGRLMRADELTPAARTRLRFVRRLVTAGILALGVVIALSQFGALNRLATSLLASSALAAAVVGFAARQVLANAVAGVMLAITQPLRIGDRVTFEGETGTVEDVRLNYTFLRTGDHRRVIIPNEKLAGGVLHNESIVDPLVSVEASLWLPREADVDRASAVLEPDLAGSAVQVAEVTPEGVRITVTGSPAPAAERAGREADLRATVLRRLRAHGLLSGADSEMPSPRRAASDG